MRIEKLGFKEEEYIIEIEKMRKQENYGNNICYESETIHLSQNELFKRIDKLNKVLIEYIYTNNLKEESIEINFRTLCRILRETEKCVILHKVCYQTEMREIVEVSNMSYFIIKYKPFICLEEDIEDINERFALYLILCDIKENNKKADSKILSERLLRELLYGLKHFDLNKEAIMLIADAIADKLQ